MRWIDEKLELMPRFEVFRFLVNRCDLEMALMMGVTI
jgi:hypothetical protein